MSDEHDIHVPGTLQSPPMTLRPKAVASLGQITEPIVGQLAVITAEGPDKGRVHVYTGGRDGWRRLFVGSRLDEARQHIRALLDHSDPLPPRGVDVHVAASRWLEANE